MLKNVKQKLLTSKLMKYNKYPGFGPKDNFFPNQGRWSENRETLVQAVVSGEGKSAGQASRRETQLCS